MNSLFFISLKMTRGDSKARKSRRRKKKRNYKKEYAQFGGKKKQIKYRSMRNKARKMLGLKVGDPREVDHVVPLSKNGSNGLHNLRVTSRGKNRRKGTRIIK